MSFNFLKEGFQIRKNQMKKDCPSQPFNPVLDIKDFKIIKQIENADIGTAYLVENIETGEQLRAQILGSDKKESQNKKSFSHELGILVKCQHPTINKFIGYSTLDFNNVKNVTIFTKFTEKGSLANYLQKIQNVQKAEIIDNTTRQIILVGITRGMMYLHLRQIIHKNLKPSNILLDQNFHPLLSDYFYSTSQSQSINSVYTAPEILKGKPYNGKADVYSFGIIMYEIVTDSPPYPLLAKGKMTPLQLAKKVTNENYRPKFTTRVKKPIQKLIEKCWSKDQKERPTFDELFKKLAFNIENIYEEKDSEENDNIPNKYYLDDVDPADVASYAESISSQLSLNSDIELKLSQFEEKIESLFGPIKTENSQLKDENQLMKAQIEELRKENEMIKERLDQLEKKERSKSDTTEIEPKSDIENTTDVTISSFNNLSLKAQKSFISKGQNEKVNSFFPKVKTVLHYLSKFNARELSSYFKITANDSQSLLDDVKEEETQIRFLWNATDLLVKNDCFNSPDFDQILSQFSDVLFDLKYPSSSFKNDYKSTLKLKKNKGNHIKIQLFITTISQTDQAFNDDLNINKVELDKNSVATIREYSFSGCTNMSGITIPMSVTLIGSFAFNGCSSLTEITIPASVTEIKEGTFNKCQSLMQITMPASVISIGSAAFKGCSSLIKIIIPSSVTKIGESAFEECTSLHSIIIPSSINKIEASMFKKCTSLAQVTIPSSVTKIGRGAFYKCSSLSRISLPSSVADIGQYAFAESSSLEKISLPDSMSEIKGKTFDGCTSLRHVTIPFSVTTISHAAFNGCVSLKKVSIPSSVNLIEDGAFPSDTETISKVLA